MISLIAAIIIVALVLVGTLAGALGVAGIGWILHRLFDLTQWQGTLVAFGVSVALGIFVYKLVAQPTWPAAPAIWDYELDEDDDFDEEPEELPIVPWRRSRPDTVVSPAGKKPSATPRGKRRK